MEDLVVKDETIIKADPSANYVVYEEPHNHLVISYGSCGLAFQQSLDPYQQLKETISQLMVMNQQHLAENVKLKGQVEALERSNKAWERDYYQTLTDLESLRKTLGPTAADAASVDALQKAILAYEEAIAASNAFGFHYTEARLLAASGGLQFVTETE